MTDPYFALGSSIKRKTKAIEVERVIWLQILTVYRERHFLILETIGESFM